MEDYSASRVRSELKQIYGDAEGYFQQAGQDCRDMRQDGWSYTVEADHYWNKLSDDTRSQAAKLIDRLLPCCASLAVLAKSSPLTGPEDVQDVKESAKGARAALRLRRYVYREAEVINDEDTVLGFRHAEQFERHGESPENALGLFDDHISKMAAVLKLVEAGGIGDSAGGTPSADTSRKYRSGTAFIMMWMDPKHPELTDVADTVRTVFKLFDIRAVRADDIQHEGQITERVRTEIRTSEFHFADLTGMRPNVYYEVGYAHALDKRVILFRKAGTQLHFDLAGYNCPEYENVRDLRVKLTNRLMELTNRNPGEQAKL